MSTFQAQIHNIRDAKTHQKFRIDTIKAIEAITGRPLIVYAANTRRSGISIPTTIDHSDITGFSDLIEGIDSKNIDIVLHSPGGSAEATERIVNLLRENFDHIRFLIPNIAYSAATMLALSGDEILMDDRSTLGPIDPQIIMSTPQGVTTVPVQEVLDAFERFRKVLKKEGVKSLPAYLPMLQKYDLHTFETCRKAKSLAKTLTQTWLEEYMLKGLPDKKKKAKQITRKFSSHKENLSHGRPIGIRKARKFGLIITDLRNLPDLRKKLWELYCAIELYFDRTIVVKLFENSRGVSWARKFGKPGVRLTPKLPPQRPQQPPRQPKR